jgi:predicted transcriptional regulator
MGTPENKGLVGLRHLRHALELTQSAVAKSAGCSEVQIRHVETGWRDCTQAFQRRLASALCCEVVDLLATPTPQRLAEIRADYTQRVADQARAEAQKSEVA